MGVFCGIASPRGFEQLILRMSGEMRFRRRFLDHYRYEVEELDRLFLQAKMGADIMVTTEKDAVRIPLGYKPIMPLYYVRMEIEIIEGFEDFEEAVAGICFTGSEKNSMSRPQGKEREFGYGCLAGNLVNPLAVSTIAWTHSIFPWGLIP